MAIDLNINKDIPANVRDIIAKADRYLHSHPLVKYDVPAADHSAFLVSQWIQQAYYIGSTLSTKETADKFVKEISRGGGA